MKIDKPTEEERAAGGLHVRSSRKAPRWIVVALLIVALPLVIGGMVLLSYQGAPTAGLPRALSRVLPLPAATVNGEAIPLRDFHLERDAYVHLLEHEGAEVPPEEEIDQNVLETLVSRLVMQQLARDLGVELDEATVEEELVAMAEDAGGEDELKQRVEESFGWGMGPFRERIVETVVLAAALEEAVLEDPSYQAEARERIDEARSRLLADEAFEDVAAAYSEDPTAAFGGDIGYFTRSSLPEDWAAVLDGLEEGEYTEVLGDATGYQIFHVDEIIMTGDDEEIGLSVIFIPKRGFDEVVQERVEEADVRYLIGEES